MKNYKNSSIGGKRKNAGRRRVVPVGAVVVSASVPPEQAAWLDQQPGGRSAAIRAAIAVAMMRS